MPLEIEAKMSVEELSRIRERLQEGGATRVGRCLEINIFFDTREQTLLSADCGLRLRHTLNVDRGIETITLTYKGPSEPGPLKRREEIEVQVDRLPEARALLEALGYSAVLSFEKRRESWQMETCRVELDELPHIGSFIEIEGPSDAAVLRIRQAIGLSDRPIIKASYIALLLEHLRERQIASRSITFGGT